MESKRKTAPKSSKKKKFISFQKVLEIFHIFILLLFIFLSISLFTYNPLNSIGSDNIGSDAGVLGSIGSKVAGEVMSWTFGRYGSFSISFVLLIILIGWWGRGKSISFINPFWMLRWASGFLIIGFFIGFGIAFIGKLNGSDHIFEITGLTPKIASDWAFVSLGQTGTLLVLMTFLTGLLVLFTNLRPSVVLGAIFISFPVLVFKFVRSSILIVSGFVDYLFQKSKGLFSSKTDNDHYEMDNASVDPISDEQESHQEIVNNIEPIISRSKGQTIKKPEKVFDGAISKESDERSLPPIRLLDLPPDDQPIITREEQEENSDRLQSKLKSLKIEAEVIKTVPGPVITRYDLRPAAEVKIARISSLSDDIAMALRARGGGVRILAPIPGEAAVGVEIPNREPATVYIREVLSSRMFRNAKSPLIIALGKDSSGEIFCTDLAKTPHLLVAGATGSGKSVCINTIIASLLYRSDPENVRLVLIDPKKLELSLYSRLSEHHLVAPPGLGELVITTPENAVRTLQSVHMEMERRYDILAEAGVRGLEDYLRWLDRTSPDDCEEDTRERLPYLVVIIDELADLMMVVRKEFEDLVVRLAQMSRAVGIHLIVATQRPSVDVVTGLIKANFPSRIAFKVASKFDSRTIIDIMGAESLLGKGDMLFLGPGTAQLMRLHGALVSTDEVEKVVEFIRAQPPCKSNFSLPDPEIDRVRITTSGNKNGIQANNDVLFSEAAKIIVDTEQGSISMLQRRLRVGYARAARMIDELEQAGVVGPFEDSKSRDVLMTREDLRENLGIE